MAARRAVTKKIINSPETCVDDNLRGVVAMYPMLQLHPKHRVVTVRSESDSGRVAVLGGGGSGHEPFAAGLVGPGLLDGAVAGGVFAAPPASHVLYAIAHLYKYNSGGVIVVFGNYAGDRLNFGKAIEKAKIAGMKAEPLIVGEDVASSGNKTGGRGMCGEIFLYKLCAGMSAKGYDIQKILDIATEVKKGMATLGVCLSACSLPGQPPLFEIAPDELEVGAGAHGEAGIEKVNMGTAKEIVTLILDKIVAHLKLTAGEGVVVMVNNMGGTSLMEMNIISAEIKDYLDIKNIIPERIYSGHLKTSLEMHGFQICLLHLKEEYGELLLELLDAPTAALGWVGGDMSRRVKGVHEDDDTLLQNDRRMAASGPALSPREQELLRDSLKVAAEKLIESEDLLNRLDSGCGDGDCGNTLKKFAQVVLTYLKTASMEYPSNLFWDLSEIAETDMGGTSGGLYSLGLSAASQAFMRAKSNEAASWLSALEGAMYAVGKYGGAEPGDRTMLDTLHAAAVALRQNLKSELKIMLKKTIGAAEEGAQATARMTARAGRASYVAREYVNDEDAGARAAAIWLKAILNFIANKY